MEADNVARGLAPGPPRPGLVPVSIIGAEDEDFENELETNTEEQNSQFQSLEQVKRRPAHLMALLQHVALQFEPGPLLCCLHADMLSSLGPKEAKKAFLDFCHCFLDKTAVLRVLVPPAVAFELDRTRPEVISEDLQRQFVQEVVQSQQAAVSRLLEDFRSKRLMGMTPWEQDLTQLEAWVGRDRASFEARERHLAERLLAHLEEMQHTISNDEEKSAAVVNAISLYMRHLGVRTKSGDKKSGMNFFRKKVMGNRRSDEPTKTKKGLSIFLDPARWNRGEPQASDFRHLKVETDAEKPGLTERKGGLGVPSRDRNVGAPGQDVPGVSLHPLPGDSPDREPGVDTPPELGDPPPQGPASLEPPGPSESTEEGPDTESPEPGDEGDPGRSGLELEPEEPPGWRELIPPGTLHSLPKSQVKRQEVISELLVTEAAHVRMLRVLHDLFYQPMLEGNFFSTEDLQNIFPSLDELIEVHSLFLDRLMKRRQDSGCLIEEIGDVLLARFDGAEGKWFQKISSRFCSRQSFALEQLKAKQRKDPRFCAFVQEAESRPRCRRLQLKDMIPTEMQRLTKYPLLLQSIGQNTEESAEREKVELAAECCREILHHVNQAVRDMEDLLRLKDYQKRLDLSLLRQSSDPMLSEFKNLDITKKKLIYEGPLTWRLTKDKAVEVHVLLLDDLLLLLQRQDDRLLLKSHSRTLTPTPDGKTMLRPVLRLTSAITREVATDHKAFYVLFTWDQEAQIYELVAQTVSERKNWCSLITETAGSLKVPAPASRPKPRPSPSSTREPLLSSSENGNGGGREMPPADGQTERILSTLLPYCRPRPEGQLAAKALEKGGGGGILSPATPPVSAWGEQHPPAWVYLRLLGPGRPFARLRATRRHRTAQLPQHLQPQGSEEREPGCQGGHAWGGPAGITASPNFPLALAFSLSCLLLGGLRASFRQGGNHSDPLPFLRPSQYCLEGAPFYSPPPSAFALFLYPELEVYFLIYII
ncbi:rho guanine nucleotide exchange factor 1 isoform X3 [Canis lupus familiaris]|uniref:Rho guanine nucleotide exchange factor 1 n=1 Tax=Canis lupus dingo TaxID=286419 RepID=A0A8C0KQK7_CANLU|nr:rho guanine nucleotide exchange factor 1 isoform X2 [Canis lupus dingo]XP_038294544.1 rho guanine nucleotide exchange factor 1 isoform X3 [Canis lupus familiaris]XP_038384709.1 rho guanine nucleotide exchange factor 1 isoform X3 [Canis lupus familiaris]XP_038512799.1 rho guanine nucleotide exchange factor 1 isoform X3 [Canis lupus familiaris]